MGKGSVNRREYKINVSELLHRRKSNELFFFSIGAFFALLERLFNNTMNSFRCDYDHILSLLKELKCVQTVCVLVGQTDVIACANCLCYWQTKSR